MAFFCEHKSSQCYKTQSQAKSQNVHKYRNNAALENISHKENLEQNLKKRQVM